MFNRNFADDWIQTTTTSEATALPTEPQKVPKNIFF